MPNEQNRVEFTTVGADYVIQSIEEAEDGFHFVMAKDVTPIADRNRLRRLPCKGLHKIMETTARRI